MFLYAQAVDFPVVFRLVGWFVSRREYLNPKAIKGGSSLQVVWISGIHSGHK